MHIDKGSENHISSNAIADNLDNFLDEGYTPAITSNSSKCSSPKEGTSNTEALEEDFIDMTHISSNANIIAGKEDVEVTEILDMDKGSENHISSNALADNLENFLDEGYTPAITSNSSKYSSEKLG